MTPKTPTDYTARWKQVDKLIEEEGLTRSAIRDIREIHTLAKNEGQQAQAIKALVYLSEQLDRVEEDADNQVIDVLQAELNTAHTPEKQLLHSILAARFVQIYEDNRYELYDRTPSSSFDEKDPETWSSEDFHRVIAMHYLASLEDAGELKKTGLKEYEPVILKGNASKLRPTLYDLLAHQALSYFKNDERDLPQPQNVFRVMDPSLFDDAADFAKMEIRSEDSSSLYLRALHIYQELVGMHLGDNDPAALLDIDLERLEYIHSVSVDPDKTKRFAEAMERIAQKYPQHPMGARASVLALNSRKEDLGSPMENRFALLGFEKAYKDIMDRFPATEAASMANVQWREITESTLTLQTELVNSRNKPFLALVSFRNIGKFHYRIIVMDNDNPVVQRTDQYWPDMIAKPFIRQVEVALPDPGDRLDHSVEIAIDSLPAGRYAILSSISPDFSVIGNVLSVQYFHVSNIAYISKNDRYYVVDRETGKPLPGCTILAMQQLYDQTSRKYKLKQIGKSTTNGEGYAKLQLAIEHRSYFMLDLQWRDDRLFINNDIYRFNNQEDINPNTFKNGLIFTDRAIYRPGQPLYFKAILINRDPKGKNNSVIAGYKTKAFLHDTNGEKIDSLVLTTNEFGSIHGQFRLPEGRLTGYYYIALDDIEARRSFRVEEYKRPTFEVNFDPIKTEFRLNDEVTVHGKVSGYAGNNLNDANISYRVVRRTLLPWWWNFGRYRGMEDAQIAYGQLKTDENGNFEIRFKAEPDLSVEKKIQPTFNYTVYVDATDISGETRSSFKDISIAYHAMNISLMLNNGQKINDTLASIPVSIKNLAGESLTSDLTLEISKLQTPNRLIRHRYWEAPDTSVMAYEEFIRRFPHDEYLNETDEKQWKTLSTASESFQQVKDGNTIRCKPLKPGAYRLVLKGKDKYGETVRDEQVITVLNTQDWTKNRPSYTINPQENIETEVGKTVKLVMGSSADSITLIRTITDGNGESEPKQVFQKNGMMSLDIKSTASDRGGIYVNHSFVKHNRIFQIEHMVTVPWNNKDLKVITETYRDKLLPGARETWKIKISGAGADNAAAELLTSMYDASLDQFAPQSWNMPDLWRTVNQRRWEGDENFTTGDPDGMDIRLDYIMPVTNTTEYDNFLWSVFIGGRTHMTLAARASGVRAMSAPPMAMADVAVVDSAVVEVEKSMAAKIDLTNQAGPKDEGVVAPSRKKEGSPAQTRKNFTETAFFFPDLKTDKDGNVEFSFTMPESLTKWKWMSFAHTKNLATGMLVKEIVTQKELMVQPNMPRFLREGDKIRFAAKVSNLADKAVTGEATLQLIDPETNAPVDGLFKNAFPVQYFTVETKQTTAVEFHVEVPAQYTKPLQYRIIAKAGNFSDGEENVIPILTNRMLVTESLPMQMIGDGTQTFSFNNLINNNSASVNHYRLTTEYSTNPAWYAVLSLPYMMEYPYECAEQTFSRLYANALAAHVAGSSPAIKTMFDTWRTSDTAALISNLLKNQDLKQVLIENTPWVFEAKTESQQRRNIALLFEAVRLYAELQKNLEKLKQMQNDEGAFPWFKGGPNNRYITQYIATGVGRLNRLHAMPAETGLVIANIASNSLEYLDRKITEDHKNLIRYKADLTKQQISPIQVQYLYMRSFFDDSLAKENKPAYDYYFGQAKTYWLQLDRQSQAMIAIALHRSGEKTVSAAIMKSLKENAIINPALGMYWKENVRGYFWYQAPVETQSVLIEAFDEVMNDKTAVEQMKLWLLNQKRVQSWESTKATADAVYALVRKGNNWLTATPQATITLGSQVIRPAAEEAGTGYTRSVIEGPKVKGDMGKVTVTVKGGAGLSWGAVHWQYFEDINKVKASATPLQLQKQFFVERRTNAGPVLEAIKEGQELRVGDKLKVRVVLKADRDMEFIHMKDMRASGTEPVNVLSGYRWQGGLGYYEATRDASTDFFFDWLPKGTWVFEYPLFVTHAGQFTAGICTIQSMYAPEFNAHSEGRKISTGPRE